MKRCYNDTMIGRVAAHTPPLTACGRIVWMNLVHKARNDLERGLSSRHAVIVARILAHEAATNKRMPTIYPWIPPL